MGYMNRIPNVKNKQKGKEGTSNKNKIVSSVGWAKHSKCSRLENATFERQPRQIPWNLRMSPYMVKYVITLGTFGGEIHPVYSGGP